MPKRSQPRPPKGALSPRTPPVFRPAVISVPGEDFKFTDTQFDDLEQAGGILVSREQRTNLLTLADFWINDLRLRRTARPKQFRECLGQMEEAFTRAEQACQWDRGLKYHLVHWAMEIPIQNAEGFPVMLAGLEQQLKTTIEIVVALKQSLPPDPGRQRPFDDERRMIYLADIYEAAGGKATVYTSSYAQTGNIADTAFRRFARLFYSFLPGVEDKRDPGGFDEALRLALMARRAQRSATG
jgi:hypothetical protein